MLWDDKKWQEGNTKVGCIPGTGLAVVSWGPDKDISMRVYFQKGESVSEIAEWMWS